MDIITLCDLIIKRLNRGIQVDKKERKAIYREFRKSRKETAIRKIGRIIERIGRWVRVLVPFRIPLGKLLTLLKKS